MKNKSLKTLFFVWTFEHSPSPVSADVKDIDVTMVISSQEGISCGVKGHMEKTHRLGLLSSADHRHYHTEVDNTHLRQNGHSDSTYDKLNASK